MDMLDTALEVIKEAVNVVLSSPPNLVIENRVKSVRYWMNRAVELADDEKVLHDNMQPHTRKVLTGKRLLPSFFFVAFGSRYIGSTRNASIVFCWVDQFVASNSKTRFFQCVCFRSHF
jgi:hypothetical protein